MAVERILGLVTTGEIRWITSSVLRAELQRNPNVAKREVSLALLTFASEVIEPSESAYQRAASLAGEGYGSFDALHLALAEEVKLDWLLTVDDRFVSRAARTRPNLLPSVTNPLDWLDRRAQWLPPPQSIR